ncbi:RNA-directed DNA polymerase from mobile element jockey [Trichonephila inaurata madagascariensis]|uniref:RNA-directed DNA polymerase from mobile element jockey n=1 Tax=Trichonephila inaurata madagascariensis TaxID=2747483 RepID=A0A8X6X4V5_9ARAC|nr:RNA-directed DNA polymerase from mobile element jockey [Trichonephila inaurata madagascariensis]
MLTQYNTAIPVSIHLKYQNNYNLIMQEINRRYPKSNSKLSGEYLKIFATSAEEHCAITNFLTEKEALFSLGGASILCGDFNAHHTFWGCRRVDYRGTIIKRILDSTDTQVIAPQTPTRFGHTSASTIDIALTRNLHWHCQVESIAELSSDHNPILISFDTNTRFAFPKRHTTTDWAVFRDHLSPAHFSFHPITARTGEDVETQVADLTNKILFTHALSSKPVKARYSSYVSTEIRELMVERNRARKNLAVYQKPKRQESAKQHTKPTAQKNQFLLK